MVSHRALWGVSLGAAFALEAHAADLLKPSIAPLPPLATSSDPSFYVHVGPGGVFLAESAKMRAGGAPIPGGNISIDPQLTAIVELGYYVSPNWAVSFTGGLPPLAKVMASGTLDGLGKLGSVRYGPATLTAHYHFDGFGNFKPYIGLGPTFMVVFANYDGVLSNLKMNNAMGVAVQAGAEYMIDRNWGVFVDVKKAYLRTNGTATLGGAPIHAKVTMDPLVLHTGVAYKF